MAGDDAQEKTEEPTEKRKRDSKEKGQVTRSKELNTTVITMSATVFMMLAGNHLAQGLVQIYHDSFSFESTVLNSSADIIQHTMEMFVIASKSLLPFLTFILLIAIFGPMLVGGLAFSHQNFIPKLERLDPIKGIKKIISWKTLVELIKSILKFTLVCALFYLAVRINMPKIFSLDAMPIDIAIQEALYIILNSMLIMTTAMVFVTFIDVPFQLWDYKRQIKMTKQELKDEMKDTEGKPEVKSKIKSLQREMRKRRMMGQVPDADVIITNPTHYSVAIKYDQDSMSAPVVVAKGLDLIAQMINKVAKAHKIPFLEAPELARSIYYHVEIDDEIPAELYVAVAQVLAYVFELKRFKQGLSEYPDKPRKFDIPEALRR